MASLLRMIPYRWPELPDPAPPAGADAVLYGQLAGILRQQSLQPHFQPIIHLGSGDLLGHEGLIRGPAGSPLHAPLALFAAAGVDLVLALHRKAAPFSCFLQPQSTLTAEV